MVCTLISLGDRRAEIIIKYDHGGRATRHLKFTGEVWEDCYGNVYSIKDRSVTRIKKGNKTLKDLTLKNFRVSTIRDYIRM